MALEGLSWPGFTAASPPRLTADGANTASVTAGMAPSTPHHGAAAAASVTVESSVSLGTGSGDGSSRSTLSGCSGFGGAHVPAGGGGAQPSKDGGDGGELAGIGEERMSVDAYTRAGGWAWPGWAIRARWLRQRAGPNVQVGPGRQDSGSDSESEGFSGASTRKRSRVVLLCLPLRRR
jgi:hypothetical protein